MAKCKSSFHWVFFLAKTCITPFIWSNMSLHAVTMWFRVTKYLFQLYMVPYQTGFRTTMRYWRRVHSSSAGKSGRETQYYTFLSHSQVISWNQLARSSNSSVELHCIFASIIGSTAIGTLAFGHLIHVFRWPGVSVFYSANIHCNINISFRAFEIF